MTDAAKERLCGVCGQWGLPLSGEQVRQFELYDALLGEWNARMDLTNVVEPVAIVDRHYLGSLTLLRYGGLDLQGQKILDLGSGAGLPGVPLSILCPQAHFTLLDATAKRVDFLSHVIDRLRLHAVALQGRAEELGRQPEHREAYDIAVSRAVAALPALLELMLPMVRVGGVAVAYKGPQLEQELPGGQVSAELLGGRPRSPIPTALPGLEVGHQLLLVDKLYPTPAKYPRRPGVPVKRPLG